jgi:hypothetical protein
VTRIRKRCTLELESPRELVLRFHGAAGQNTPAAYEATTPTAEQIAARFGEGPIWLAEQEGDVVGTVSVVPQWARSTSGAWRFIPQSRGEESGRISSGRSKASRRPEPMAG